MNLLQLILMAFSVLARIPGYLLFVHHKNTMLSFNRKVFLLTVLLSTFHEVTKTAIKRQH